MNGSSPLSGRMSRLRCAAVSYVEAWGVIRISGGAGLYGISAQGPLHKLTPARESPREVGVGPRLEQFRGGALGPAIDLLGQEPRQSSGGCLRRGRSPDRPP